MVSGTVRSLGGDVAVDSEPGHGTSVRLTLPACADTAVVSSRPLARPSLSGVSGTVLVVDDEPMVRRGTGRALKRLGFEPVEAASGYEAIETLRGNLEPIDIALVDLSMPGLSGADTIERLLEIKPDLRVIVATGHFHDAANRAGEFAGVRGYLQKPFDLAQLETAILQTRDSGMHPLVNSPTVCSAE
jgi:CheY-like chemotaxis protein